MISKRQEKVIDYLKHLMTLCTGSLGLLVTFFDRIAINQSGAPRQASWLVGFAIVSFLASLLALMCCHTWLVLHYGVTTSRKQSRWLGAGLLIGWVMFFLGLLGLGSFGIINLL